MHISTYEYLFNFLSECIERWNLGKEEQKSLGSFSRNKSSEYISILESEQMHNSTLFSNDSFKSEALSNSPYVKLSKHIKKDDLVWFFFA